MAFAGVALNKDFRGRAAGRYLLAERIRGAALVEPAEAWLSPLGGMWFGSGEGMRRGATHSLLKMLHDPISPTI
jgi:hypothetical protein